MSRTIWAIALALGLAAVAGCGGSKPEPSLPKADLNPDAPPPVTPQPPPAPPDQKQPDPKKPDGTPSGPEYLLEQVKHAVPPHPARGRLAGVDAAPTAELQGAELTFTAKGATPADARKLRINLAPMLVADETPPPVVNRQWKVALDAEPGALVPHVWLEEPGKNPFFAPSGYALTLELGQRANGKVAGKIYLCLVDGAKTVLAGTFEAAYTRTYTDPLGPDDAPYVGGEVAVTNVKPKAELRVGYVAFTAETLFKQLQLECTPTVQFLPDPEPATRPRASLLASGDGKARPFRYEHTKLPPGRYLVFATIADGPTVWKWLDLPAGGMLTENFVLDASKTGGAQVSVPPEMTGKVTFGPADAADKPPLESGLFVGVAFHTVRKDADIVAGKALVENLAPGKYEVRAGELRGFVEIVAGKRVDVALMPPKK